MADTLSNPHRRGKRVETPLQLQAHAAECGAACLRSVLGYFGLWVPMPELRIRCDVSRDGSSAASLVRAARHYGVKSGGICADAEDIKKLDLPLILFWDNCHFVILEGWDRNGFRINDPASGRRRMSVRDFNDSYSRVALHFKVTDGFVKGGELTSITSGLSDWLPDYRRCAAVTALLGALLGGLALATPLLGGMFLDASLGRTDVSMLLIGIGLVVATLGAFLITQVKERFLGQLAIKSSIAGYDRYLSRLMKLPADYFTHRMTGDLAIRVLSIDSIAQGISRHSGQLVADLAKSVIFLFAMLVISPFLGLVILLIGLLNAALSRWIMFRRSDAGHALKREQGTLLGIGTLVAQRIEFIRMTSADSSMFARWCAHQAREHTARARVVEFTNANSASPLLFGACACAAVVLWEAPRIGDGISSPGQLFTLVILSGMFLAPIGRFVEFLDLKQTLDFDMQRLDEIVQTKEDSDLAKRSVATPRIQAFNGRLRLAGHLEIRSVSFGHRRGQPPLIKDFSLQIHPGQRVAIVGASGTGKSTLVRLVAGILEPTSGEILFDGSPRSAIHPDVVARSMSLVDQNVVLFSASVRDNITMWNSIYTDSAVVSAAKDADIHDEILRRPDGYGTMVEEEGSNFSGGQRQRLEIARALVGDPSLLILDEATSALDAMSEARVDDALRRRGVSCLIIAHRLSTVRDCDEIIVLHDGRDAERGTHAELMEVSDGIYRQMIEIE